MHIVGEINNVLGESYFYPTHITFKIIATSTSLINLFKLHYGFDTVSNQTMIFLFSNSQHFHLLCLNEQGNSAELQNGARCELDHWQPFLCEIFPFEACRAPVKAAADRKVTE